MKNAALWVIAVLLACLTFGGGWVAWKVTKIMTEVSSPAEGEGRHERAVAYAKQQEEYMRQQQEAANQQEEYRRQQQEAKKQMEETNRMQEEANRQQEESDRQLQKTAEQQKQLDQIINTWQRSEEHTSELQSQR